MQKRNFLLGAAAGFAAGYATYRAYQSFAALGRPIAPAVQDPAAYGRTRRALAVAGIARSLAGATALAFGPAADALESAARRAPVWLRPIVYAAAGTLIDGLFEAPVDFVEGFFVERRYGLSEQTAPAWASDRVKEQLIGTGVTGLLAGLLGAALRRWPAAWPYVASACAFPLLLLANIAVPLYVMPLFNKYEPIEGPLERRLRALADRFGVGDAEILRVDMSRQTKKANAFVIGIGSTHRIVVGDTLIEHFPEDEIEFVVAHELGHYVSKDSWRMIAAAQAGIVAMLFASYFAIGDRGSEPAQSPALPARLYLFASLFSQALRPVFCAFARSREWAADRFALETTATPRAGASAFRRLRDQNLAEDEQPAWYEFFFSTHPSLKARIAALESGASD